MKTLARYWRQLALLVCLVVVAFSCASPQKQKTESFNLNRISESEAVRLAEEFIRVNGYTDLPYDKSKLSDESIEWASDSEELVKVRYNTLKRKACGILPGRRRSDDGWTVVFHYNNGINHTTGRAVTMDADGRDIRMEHVEFILDRVKND